MTASVTLLTPSFAGPEGQEDMPYLLTPGPLTTSRAVKLAMLADYGSRDIEFRQIVAEVRRRLLEIAGCGPSYECVIMQGAGTFAIEAALGSFCPDRRRKTLVVINGAYGERAAKILERIGKPYATIEKAENESPTVEEIGAMLDADRTISHVFIVHCETTSGIINPVAEITKAAKGRGKTVMVDAMSSFGAISIDMEAAGIDVLVSSSNKCIEGVPGFSYVLCKRLLLEASLGKCHSIVLDLYEQWKGLEKNGQFRFTPPTHALVAFHEALKEHEKEGGVEARGTRYRKNAELLVSGMRQLGFHTLLNDEQAGPIIQTFLTPRDVNFDFEKFYQILRKRGYAIYPGKLTKRPSFRIGTIGQIDGTVIQGVLRAIKDALKEMDVKDMRPIAA